MGKQADAQYICANCEYDFTGFPAGARPGDGRPLCRRCAIGDGEEKVADVPVVMPEKKSSGLWTIFYGVGTLILLAVLLASYVLCRDRH